MSRSEDRLSEGKAPANHAASSDRRDGVAGAWAPPPSATTKALGGAFALPGSTEKVTAELVVREISPLTRELLIAFTDMATGQRIMRFDEELTQEVHVLATDTEFSSFVHEHAGKLGLDGYFRVTMRFPKPGIYYVYADAMPTGIGQQVIRFEIPVAATMGLSEPQQACGSVDKADAAPYSVKLDASSLRVGTASMMALTILKDDMPAIDLELYLGVPAHAVFVGTDDLCYVHAHAMAAGTPKDGHTTHRVEDNPQAAIPAKLMLHATIPRAGRYALWIQFKAGGKVRTTPFVLNVPAVR